MTNQFSDALKGTLKNEGGLNEQEIGQGGVSNYGITQRTFDGYNKALNQPIKSVREISQPEVRDIYSKQFYHGPKISSLPTALRTAVFDYAVQSGPSRAIKALQSVVGAKVDGVIGPETLMAIDHAITTRGSAQVANEFANKREAFVEKLISENPKTFGKIATGLRNRIKKARNK